jgi:hypothetical protein
MTDDKMRDPEWLRLVSRAFAIAAENAQIAVDAASWNENHSNENPLPVDWPEGDRMLEQSLAKLGIIIQGASQP